MGDYSKQEQREMELGYQVANIRIQIAGITKRLQGMKPGSKRNALGGQGFRLTQSVRMPSGVLYIFERPVNDEQD